MAQPRTGRPKAPPTKSTLRKDKGVSHWPHENKSRALGLLLAGHNFQEVQAATGVPRQTLCRWWEGLTPEVKTAVDVRRNEILAGRIWEFCAEGLAIATAAYRELLTDPAYLKKHTPHDNAILLGSFVDKIDRIQQRAAELQLLSAPEDRAEARGTGGQTGQVITIEYVDDNDPPAAAALITEGPEASTETV